MKFFNYLKDDNVTIDYTYIWDFFNPVSNSGLLFQEGVNMIIFNSQMMILQIK